MAMERGNVWLGGLITIDDDGSWVFTFEFGYECHVMKGWDHAAMRNCCHLRYAIAERGRWEKFFNSGAL